MGDTQKNATQSADHKNVLPDVVHSQQIPTMETVVDYETESFLDTGQSTEGAKSQDVEDKTESISEHVPSKIDYSISESENVLLPHSSHNFVNVDGSKEKVSDISSNILPTHSTVSENFDQDPSKHSWNLDIGKNVNLSKESPINLALSSDSKDTHHDEKSLSIQSSEYEREKPEESDRNQSDQFLHAQDENNKQEEENKKLDSPKDSLHSEYLDSLNGDSSNCSHLIDDKDNYSEKSNNCVEKGEESPSKCRSGSEEIIKLDIRGHGVPKFPIQASKIIFGAPPGSTVVDTNIETIPTFHNLLSPFLVGTSEGVRVEEIFDEIDQKCELPSPDKSPVESLSSDKTEKDLLVEEMTIENTKEKEKSEDTSPVQPKSMPAEDTISFSTLTTDYKTICEEYQAKLVHFEDAITRRDELIEELTVSLQRSIQERDLLRVDNDHLTRELQNLQHVIGERPQSEQDTIQAQLSDYMKYQSMLKDDSTKFYSAIMSGTNSLQSSNGEKDIDREEIMVNCSKSDLRSSETDEFENGFETKVVTLLNKFEEYIEENLRNKLRESIIQVLCDEIGKMRIDFDTEIKELEAQLQQDKQAFSIETRRLRELLSSVKAGNADIDLLREELSIKHEKEMENLRTYFEKKCSDLERSYSEEVWRGRACVSPAVSLQSECADAAGDCRRRTRSADLPSLTQDSTPMEQMLKQAHKNFERQIEDLKSEHLAYVNELQTRHREVVVSLEEQVIQLKAHIQTAENTESNVSIYQQDIDLELEKSEVETRLEQVRQEVLQQVQEQIKVSSKKSDTE
ncbi:unnamed protein product [Parnassius apollo]|uniref:(apollo) hypothetical protein n=1 Tax=Parnassius apollo TaxID=110799 RepID=A0A8S3W6B0_PARAO|nr:unnamed protein product [Parnassius apollo]